MKITRVWAMPNRWTFQIHPIKELVERYTVGGTGWVDPFCGESKYAEYRNDLNPKIKDCSHLTALDFVNRLTGVYDGILFDPPYSGRQVKECYTNLNKIVHIDDTNPYFYWSIKREIAPKIKRGGIAISCGWNTCGFGKKLGFKIIEILDVCHGSSHNDTLVTVERKVL